MILALADDAGVDLPEAAPQKYAPLCWDEVRACERLGMTFGPHTVTHPILSRVEKEQLEREVRGSWQRLQTETAKPVSVFCYPNGRSQDFGLREIEHIRAAGMGAAVTGEAGYAPSSGRHARHDDSYRIHRFPLLPDLVDVVQAVSGVERFKQIVRGGVR